MLNNGIKQSIIILALALVLAVAVSLSAQSSKPEVSFDGLHLHPDKDVAALYLKPEVEFSDYTRFMMLDTYVAFRKNWQRDTKVAGRRVSNKEMEKIKHGVAELFQQTFKEQMEEDDGYPLVDKADDNVLLLRPAIIDLDITAPDIPVAGRVTNYVASTGAATMYLELYDSVSGEILARIVDRRRMGDYGGTMRWSSSVSNRADASRLFKRWADMLRKGLDEVHEEAYKTDRSAG